MARKRPYANAAVHHPLSAESESFLPVMKRFWVVVHYPLGNLLVKLEAAYAFELVLLGHVAPLRGCELEEICPGQSRMDGCNSSSEKGGCRSGFVTRSERRTAVALLPFQGRCAPR